MLETQFQIKPSKHLLCAMLMVLLATMLIVLCVNLTIIFKIILLSLLFFYGRKTLVQYGLLKQRAITMIICTQASLKIKVDQTLLDAQLCSDSVITSVVAFLRFKTPLGYQSTILLRDSLAPDLYRRLVVALIH